MNNRRPYVAESEINPGCVVVQGSTDRKVKAPGANGTGDIIGVYPYEGNAAKSANEEIGIVLHGVVKALAGGTVTAGKIAVLKKDNTGALVTLPSAAGQYTTAGVFLESGGDGDYVDVFFSRSSIVVS